MRSCDLTNALRQREDDDVYDDDDDDWKRPTNKAIDKWAVVSDWSLVVITAFPKRGEPPREGEHIRTPAELVHNRIESIGTHT